MDYIDYWLPPEGDLPSFGRWKGFRLGSENDSSLPASVLDLLARVRMGIADRLLDPVNLVMNLSYTKEENKTVFYKVDLSQEIRTAI